MKGVVSVALLGLAGLAAACGDNVVANPCEGYVETSTQAGAFPNEEAAAKAKEHLKQAKASFEKNDEEGCKTHVKAAKDALKL